ncbi:murein L,D-transpeptidase catalytic domain family protein [Bdellovibrio bacteriovorus]|uniref:murein L,D-transpeptidase catalytic domain family protein n=1 Tax=Bdellovibrio TaxID=958 RepID=UPI0035A8E2E9
MNFVRAITSALVVFSSLNASAAPSASVTKKILSQGVPQKAYEKLVKYMDEFQGRSFNQDTYSCEGRDADSIRPCEEEKRRRSNRTVTLNSPTYVAIVDFGSPSSQRRFYLINLKSGDVNKYYVSHGLGSGKGDVPTKFSNIKDSKQTSLGMYLTGEVYQGHYGNTLRMYGLQGSNDEAFNRDIVLHGAWYVGEDFINSTNERTGQKYGRLGVSWGCPAVSLAIAEKIIPLLKGGSLIMHYHPTLMDEALSGKEVTLSQK